MQMRLIFPFCDWAISVKRTFEIGKIGQVTLESSSELALLSLA